MRAGLTVTTIVLWALLVTSVIMSMNESACVGLTIAFFLAFYVISAITFPSTYTVYVLGERIAYIDNPTLGMVAVIPGTTILLYFYLAMAFAFCHCFTKIFPKGCEFYFAFEVVILLFLSVAAYEIY